MKKLLIGIIVQLSLFNALRAQTPNALIVHQGVQEQLYPLNLIDSINCTSDTMHLHAEGIQTSYPLFGIDSVKYNTLASTELPCGFGGYTGAYGSITDSRDNQVYKTVVVGNQTWLAENLNYDVPGVYTTGTVIDTINPNNPCKNYGRLYDWATIKNGTTSSSGKLQGICPNGWHIPSEQEIQTLELYLGMSQSAMNQTNQRGTDQGTKMKALTSWTSGARNNSSGFNVIGTGYYYSQTGKFRYFNESNHIWSSSEITGGTTVWARYIGTFGGIYRGKYPKTYGFSCRCVKD